MCRCCFAGQRPPCAAIEDGKQPVPRIDKRRQRLRRYFARIEVFRRGRFAVGGGKGTAGKCIGVAEIAFIKLFAGKGCISGLQGGRERIGCRSGALGLDQRAGAGG